MLERKTVSQCISSDYCKGWNDAVDAMSKWISVEERLPEKVGMVLAVIYGSVWVVWYKSGGKFESPSGLEFKDGAVSNWMPLPEPPEEEECE